MRLYLDDIREMPEEYKKDWTMIRDPREAMDLIIDEKITHISLDHDLGVKDDDGREITGRDVALFLALAVSRGVAKIPEQMSCHSANPPGRDGITSVFENIRKYMTS